mgnify:FL=1|tara:strand:+ start:58 stop:264 length:207 start_codon:yes stop_codon:yes gene_type:complete
MALADSDNRLKRIPDNDRSKMKSKAERVLTASADPQLDAQSQAMFGIPYDQLGPFQIIAVNAALGKKG